MNPSVKIYNRTKSARIRKKHYKLIEKELKELVDFIIRAVNKFVEMIRSAFSKIKSDYNLKNNMVRV
ncbi:hypothetical protein [Clostridium sp.]|uniref:hypothetical protein n=1 Tax=Clostridium sp. TaxID=1506 RepID=UPI0029021BF3|nr:hypothetical protein [Clostridium sp.]MDU2106546.1 hypothetical protein [Clostridium sp.]MDU3353586.1 hypothetical protein [Clostridium sp.]